MVSITIMNKINHINFLFKGHRFYKNRRKFSIDRNSLFPEIIYEDNHILVIFKPHGILSQGGFSHENSVRDYIKDYLIKRYGKPGDAYLGIVHRLDRSSSGLMLLAKTSKAATRLSEQFRTRKITKEYICIVQGKLMAHEGECMHYITKCDIERKMKTVAITNNKNQIPVNGQLCTLTYTLLDFIQPSGEDFKSRKSNNICSLIKVNLETGRKHQIRAQMADLGHPIYGDAKYGSSHRFIKNGIALHAWRISFVHPITKAQASSL